jgi:hypothetical protein
MICKLIPKKLVISWIEKHFETEPDAKLITAKISALPDAKYCLMFTYDETKALCNGYAWKENSEHWSEIGCFKYLLGNSGYCVFFNGKQDKSVRAYYFVAKEGFEIAKDFEIIPEGEGWFSIK